MSRTREWGKRLAWIAGAGAGFYAWTEFLWKHVHEFLIAHPNATFSELLLNLINPFDNLYEVPFGGWAFLIASAALLIWLAMALRSVANYFDISRRGLSIIDSTFELLIEDEEMTEATLSRTQLVHANRSGIAAYRSISNVENPGAEIQLDLDRTFSMIDGDKITKHVLRRGGSTNIELIEAYERALPTNLVATYLPSELVRMLFNNGMFQKLVVRRHLVVRQLREYCGETGIMSVTAAQFPATSISLKISFPEKTAPNPDHISCFWISENVVRPRTPIETTKDGRRTYEVTARNLYQASLRFQWSNARLKQHLKAKANGAKRTVGAGVQPPAKRAGGRKGTGA